MIDWESLYYNLLTSKKSSSKLAERHHVVPKHDGGDESDLVPLERRYHTLAHYIRYRWKRQVGDRLAYKMMSGALINPMHDLEFRKAYANLRANPEDREKKKKGAIIRWSNKDERLKQSIRRRKYVSTLKNPSVLSKHLNQDEDIKARAIKGYRSWAIHNRDVLLSRLKKANKVRDFINSNLTEEELRAKYSRGSGEENPNWAGYVVLEKNDIRLTFSSMADFKRFCQKTRRPFAAFSKYLNAKSPIRVGRWKKWYISRVEVL